jgi:hypothetical protein
MPMMKRLWVSQIRLIMVFYPFPKRRSRNGNDSCISRIHLGFERALRETTDYADFADPKASSIQTDLFRQSA